ncbi:unnamed protein product, partial [Polarella glacialis]
MRLAGAELLTGVCSTVSNNVACALPLPAAAHRGGVRARQSRSLPASCTTKSDVCNALALLGSSPGASEVLAAVGDELPRWRRNPALATVTLSALARNRRPQVALQVLELMLAQCVEVNVFHYNSAISACEKAGEWQRASSVLSIMSVAGVMPNVVSYSTCMSSCEKGFQWQLALNLLCTMPRASVVPNEFSCNSAISACEKGLQWHLALGLFCKMPGLRL